MFYKDNYDTLFDYYTNNTINLTKEEALEKISFWAENNNSWQVDFIDYEQLIFLELKFLEDDEILEKIYLLKSIIADNYAKRQKLLFKMNNFSFR